MIWRATQLLAGSRPDSEELLAKLNAYELKEYKYFSLNTAMAEKARDDTAEAAAEVAKLVEGPDGIVFQHRARLSGRPLETVGEAGGAAPTRQQTRGRDATPGGRGERWRGKCARPSRRGPVFGSGAPLGAYDRTADDPLSLSHPDPPR